MPWRGSERLTVEARVDGLAEGSFLPTKEFSCACENLMTGGAHGPNIAR